MLSRSRRRARGDDGVALPLVALCMIVLLAMAALVVDIAQVYNARRQDQSAADAGALAAAQDLGDDIATAASAIAFTNATLPEDLVPAAYDTCAADIVPTGYTKLVGANCVSVNTARTRVRVRVPDQEVESTFGNALGITSHSHTAFAIAGLTRQGFGGVLPFALQASAQVYGCLKAGAGNVPDAQCSGADQGNFGFLNFGWWGNDEVGTTQDCAGNGRGRVPNNIAVGVDHDLSRYNALPHGTTVVEDTASCGATPSPNAAFTLTGNTPQTLGHGIFSGTGMTDGEGARLQRVGLLSYGASTTIGPNTVDDTPLWEFIPDTLPLSTPASCAKNQFVGDDGGLDADNDGIMANLPTEVESHLSGLPTADRMLKLLQRCITHYHGDIWTDTVAGNAAFLPGEASSCPAGGCTDPVFGRDDATGGEPGLYDIQKTPRFAYVPRLTTDGLTWNGTTGVLFDYFQPVYIQRVYGGNCNPGSCDIEFDPGVGYASSDNSDKANAVSAFILPPQSLPGRLGEPDAPFAIGVNKFVGLVR